MLALAGFLCMMQPGGAKGKHMIQHLHISQRTVWLSASSMNHRWGCLGSMPSVCLCALELYLHYKGYTTFARTLNNCMFSNGKYR
eukprot:832380-Amphidinium_carterae.1